MMIARVNDATVAKRSDRNGERPAQVLMVGDKRRIINFSNASSFVTVECDLGLRTIGQGRESCVEQSP